MVVGVGGKRSKGPTGARVGWAGQKTSPGSQTYARKHAFRRGRSFIPSRILGLLLLSGGFLSSDFILLFFFLIFFISLERINLPGLMLTAD